jgi:sugar/nucleoside kinase (ribokinase family)
MSMIQYCRPGLEAMLGASPGGESSSPLDYLFCNEEEAQVWCGAQDFEEVCVHMARLARVVCLTRSAKGSVILENGERTVVPAVPIKALESNGAGDMFAGAFLYAVTHGHSRAEAAALGNYAAAQVVSQYGNRLSASAVAGVLAQFPALTRTA